LIDKIGKYQITEKIGVGGFGTVYKGRDPYIKRVVAVKTCQSEDEEIKKRFFKEAEFAGNLDHPNIVRIYDFGVENGIPYIVQEYLTGEDLDKKIKRRELVPLDRKLQILIQVCDALDYAHRNGIIHRDIKPANIRIMDDGKTKIMDFGIAKSLNMESTLTQTGITLGTAAYLAPEQIKGEPIDQRTDIFSLGVMMYEMFAFDRPFKGDHISTVLYRILHEEAPDLATVDPSLPPRLCEIVRNAMEKDASRRYDSVGTLKNDLSLVYQAIGGTFDQPTGFVRTHSPASSSTGISVDEIAARAARPEESGSVETLTSEEKTRTTPTGIRTSPEGPPPPPEETAPPPAPSEPPERTKTSPSVRPQSGGERKKKGDERRKAIDLPITPTPEPPPNPARREVGAGRLFLGLLFVAALAGGGLFLYRRAKETVGPPPPIPATSGVSGTELSPPEGTGDETPTASGSTEVTGPELPATAASASPSATATGKSGDSRPTHEASASRSAPPPSLRPVEVQVTSNLPMVAFWDGKPLGDPDEIFRTRAQPGKHSLRFVIEGYQEHTIQAEVRPDGPNRFRYDFPEWGRLTVQADPDSAEGNVFIDGKPKGASPLVGLKLEKGSHLVEVRKEGYPTWKSTIEIVPSQPMVKTFLLKRSGG
jgi:serine/threonine-protein kinase